MIEQISRWDQDWAVRFPKRVKRRDKERFLDEIDQELKANNFETSRLSARYLLQNRILLTECENPKVIFTAHYDTPTIMPFWVSPFFKVLGHTRQISGGILLVFILYAPLILSPFLVRDMPGLLVAINFFYLLLALSLFTILIPNPHNREDNTSGVIGLLALADWLQDKPDLRKQVQLVFLDNEELGLLGSNALKNHWEKNNYPYQKAAVINLDCVTRGRIPLIVHHGNDTIAKSLLPYLQKHLPEITLFGLPYLPLSDNYTFRKTGAIDISYADRSLIPGGYYIPKIHVPADNDFSAERLLPLINALTDYLSENVIGK
jgi:hypothetical protein